jgi:hypothetical protein
MGPYRVIRQCADTLGFIVRRLKRPATIEQVNELIYTLYTIADKIEQMEPHQLNCQDMFPHLDVEAGHRAMRVASHSMLHIMSVLPHCHTPAEAADEVVRMAELNHATWKARGDGTA